MGLVIESFFFSTSEKQRWLLPIVNISDVWVFVKWLDFLHLIWISIFQLYLIRLDCIIERIGSAQCWTLPWAEIQCGVTEDQLFTIRGHHSRHRHRSRHRSLLCHRRSHRSHRRHRSRRGQIRLYSIKSIQSIIYQIEDGSFPLGSGHMKPLHSYQWERAVAVAYREYFCCWKKLEKLCEKVESRIWRVDIEKSWLVPLRSKSCWRSSRGSME